MQELKEKRLMSKSTKFSIFILVSLLVGNAIPVFADLPFRNHRYSSFQTLPENKQGDIVFIGNSITNMMNWNELFGSRENIKNRGTSGAFTQEILDNLESMIAGNPSKIFLMIGTNDLGTEGTPFLPEAVAYRIEKILSRIRKEVPDAEVYYQSILPSTKGLRTESKTTETNRLVRNWIKSQNDPKLTYIDLYTPLSDSGQLANSSSTPSEGSYSYDGLHLTQKGYKIWADLIKEHVGYQPVISDEAINLWGELKGSTGMRVTHFGAFPIKEKDVLIFGDEMVHGGEWSELLGSADFKDRGSGWGFPGMSLGDIESILEPALYGNGDKGVLKQSPKALLFYAGTSNLIKGDSIADIVSKYKHLINKTQELSPATPIFLMSLVPAGKKDNKINDGIKEFNKELSELCNLTDNIFLIDLYPQFIDGEGRKEILFTEPASTYLNGLGYAKVAEIIAQKLNQELNLDYKALSYENALENLKRYNRDTEERNQTFIVFDNANSDVPYRIPAIAKNKNGDLIAVADYRYSKADIGMAKNGRLDLRYRIKDAETGEWGEIKTLAAAFGEGDSNIAFGDPCIVADRESDRVLVTSCSGNVSFPKGTHENHQGWARFLSEDGGKTWSEYEEIGDQVFNLLDKRSDGPINAFFIGSGKISQSPTIKVGDSYRIYCAALVRVNDGKTKVNYVFYSDDFGKNWNLLGDVDDCPIPFGADEPKAEELPDGSVLVSSRISGGRYYNIFRYSDVETGEGKWESMATSDSSVKGIKASSNACNGETLVVPAINNKNKEFTYLLLQSVPMNSEGLRANVGINYKDLNSLEDSFTPADVAKDWDGYFEVTPFSSGYSTMVLDKDNDVAFFYEENSYNGGYDMKYRKLSVEDITNGKYSVIQKPFHALQ